MSTTYKKIRQFNKKYMFGVSVNDCVRYVQVLTVLGNSMS